jgi:endogenous inhibitor of DNA gyrase (YacG/DUF329 family)
MTGGGAETARPIPLRPPRDCPICGRKSVREAYPFCSRRCADVDLGRWLTGAYAIPAGNADDQDQPDEGRRKAQSAGSR